jgi:hypothetical protein
MFRDGSLNGMVQFMVQPVVGDGDEFGVQTVVIALIPSANSPVVLIDRHDDDDSAMKFALRLFDMLKSKGLASSRIIANWRRGLICAVPNFGLTD